MMKDIHKHKVVIINELFYQPFFNSLNMVDSETYSRDDRMDTLSIVFFAFSICEAIYLSLLAAALQSLTVSWMNSVRSRSCTSFFLIAVCQ